MTITALVQRVRAEIRTLAWRIRGVRPTNTERRVVAGPPWFVALVSDSFDVVDDADADPSTPRIGWGDGGTGSEQVSTPFVSLSRSYPGSLRRLPSGVPETFRELDAQARRRPDDSCGEQNWIPDAHRRHLEARAARTTTIEQLVRVGGSTGSPIIPPPIDDGVDVVCVSFRLDLLPALVEQFDRQTHPNRTLTIVRTAATAEGGAHGELERICRDRTDIELHDRPDVSLGNCLNEALATGRHPLMAKWDDDDLYGPHYLSDLVLERRATEAAVVGKHSYFTYLEAHDATYLRFPRRSHRDVRFVAGGTLLVDRVRTAGIRFPEVNIGEDRGFLESCAEGGLRIRSADPFNYVQIRSSDNTWQVPDTVFLERSVTIGDGLDLAAVFV